jgi:hypothetical protein
MQAALRHALRGSEPIATVQYQEPNLLVVQAGETGPGPACHRFERTHDLGFVGQTTLETTSAELEGGGHPEAPRAVHARAFRERDWPHASKSVQAAHRFQD